MEINEVIRVIQKHTTLKNMNARYRLKQPIISYRAVDTGGLKAAHMLDTDSVRQLAYRDIGGLRVYFSITGDYMRLYVEGGGTECPDITDSVLGEFSRSLQFAYTSTDVDAVLRKMPGEEDVVAALELMGIGYDIVGVESRVAPCTLHLAIQEYKDMRVYDRHLGLMGLPAGKYREMVQADYWIDKDLGRTGCEVVCPPEQNRQEELI